MNGKIRRVLILLILPLILFSYVSEAVELRTPTGIECEELLKRGQPCSLVSDKDVQTLGLTNFGDWLMRIKSNRPCASNVCNRACKTNNTGAIIYSAHTRKWGATGFEQAKYIKLSKFPSVSHGFAAHVDLLRKYCGTHKKCTIASAIHRWAPGNAHGNKPNAYANTVSKITGIPVSRVYNPNDPNAVGRIAAAMACVENGGFPYNFGEIKKGLEMAMGGKSYPAPANVGEVQPFAPSRTTQPDPLSPHSSPDYSPPVSGSSSPEPHSSASSWGDPQQKDPHQDDAGGVDNEGYKDGESSSATNLDRSEEEGDQDDFNYAGDDTAEDDTARDGATEAGATTETGVDTSTDNTGTEDPYTGRVRRAPQLAPEEGLQSKGSAWSVGPYSITYYLREPAERIYNTFTADRNTADKNKNKNDVPVESMDSFESFGVNKRREGEYYRDIDARKLPHPWLKDVWKGGSSPVRTRAILSELTYGSSGKIPGAEDSPTEAEVARPNILKRTASFIVNGARVVWRYFAHWRAF